MITEDPVVSGDKTLRDHLGLGPFAWRPVSVVAAAAFTLFLATNSRYGYHRDELYFRVLGRHPGWGYVDEPPLTPLLGRASTALFGDNLWALRLPAAVTLATVAVLIALICRELGGGRGPQILAACVAFTAFPMIGGHTLATATIDLAVWSAVILFVTRALLRDEPRWWLAAGTTVGLGLYNKHLVALLLIGLAVGLLVVGPRRALRSPWLWGGVVLAVVLGAPNLIYQVVNDWPQLKMAQALTENKGADARADFLPLQILMLGPPLVVIWVAGLIRMLRAPQLRPVRALAVAYPVICLLVLVIGGQPYYTFGLIVTYWAAGCVPVVRWAAGHRWRLGVVGAVVAANAALSAVIALPVVPERDLGNTAIPEINQVVRDQVGWPAYVQEIAEVYRTLPDAERARSVVVTGNYGEHGAVDRYGPRYGLPAVYSGQNELYYLGPPPDSADVVVLVVQADDAWAGARFDSCDTRGRLDNRLGVDNEEQQVAIRICRGPKQPWHDLWPRFQHYD